MSNKKYIEYIENELSEIDYSVLKITQNLNDIETKIKNDLIEKFNIDKISLSITTNETHNFDKIMCHDVEYFDLICNLKIFEYQHKIIISYTNSWRSFNKNDKVYFSGDCLEQYKNKIYRFIKVDGEDYWFKNSHGDQFYIRAYHVKKFKKIGLIMDGEKFITMWKFEL